MDRLGYIGGTDSQRIMAGDWVNLYREKKGLKQPDHRLPIERKAEA